MQEKIIKQQLLPAGCEPSCPGCAHRYLTPEQSLAQKETWLKNRLLPWASRVAPIRTVDESARWGYRKKVCLSAQWQSGKWAFGLIKNESVIPIHGCPVHARPIRDAVLLFSAVLPDPEFFPLAYFVQTGSQITLVVKSKQMPDLSWLKTDMTRKLAQMGIRGLWLHLNPCTGKKVFAKNTWHLLFGAPWSVDEHHLSYGPGAFAQLLPILYSRALSSAETFLSPGTDDIFIDLYCGIGTGLVRWRQQCNNVMGVELDGEAAACAQKNAPDTTILRGRCKDRIPQLIQWADAYPPGKRRLLYVNPPRTGLEGEVLEWIIDSYKPDRMVYLSCSAGTLARDLACLEKHNFQIDRVIPFDFFPQTLHVETLVFIKGRGKK